MINIYDIMIRFFSLDNAEHLLDIGDDEKTVSRNTIVFDFGFYITVLKNFKHN